MGRVARLLRRTAPAGDVAGRLVYRPVLMRVLLVLVAGFGVCGVADLAVRGQVGASVSAGLWLIAGVSALACLCWRPAVTVDRDAVELRNVVRDVRVPWSCLDDVTTRYTLTLHVAGERHQSWAGAAPGRGSAARRLPDERWNPTGSNPPTSSRDLRADSGASAFMVEQGWRAWRERQAECSAVTGSAGSYPGEQVEVRWQLVLPGIAVVAAGLAAVLTSTLA